MDQKQPRETPLKHYDVSIQLARELGGTRPGKLILSITDSGTGNSVGLFPAELRVFPWTQTDN